jgi:hypothetical protein
LKTEVGTVKEACYDDDGGGGSGAVITRANKMTCYEQIGDRKSRIFCTAVT